MVARIARLFLRLIGWLLTPLLITVAAAIGAMAFAAMGQQLSITRALVLTTLGGLIGATLGGWGWLHMLRGSRELRDVLQVTPAGVPTEVAIDAILGAERPEEHR